MLREAQLIIRPQCVQAGTRCTRRRPLLQPVRRLLFHVFFHSISPYVTIRRAVGITRALQLVVSSGYTESLSVPSGAIASAQGALFCNLVSRLTKRFFRFLCIIYALDTLGSIKEPGHPLFFQGRNSLFNKYTRVTTRLSSNALILPLTFIPRAAYCWPTIAQRH